MRTDHAPLGVFCRSSHPLPAGVGGGAIYIPLFHVVVGFGEYECRFRALLDAQRLLSIIFGIGIVLLVKIERGHASIVNFNMMQACKHPVLEQCLVNPAGSTHPQPQLYNMGICNSRTSAKHPGHNTSQTT